MIAISRLLPLILVLITCFNCSEPPALLTSVSSPTPKVKVRNSGPLKASPNSRVIDPTILTHVSGRNYTAGFGDGGTITFDADNPLPTNGLTPVITAVSTTLTNATLYTTPGSSQFHERISITAGSRDLVFEVVVLLLGPDDTSEWVETELTVTIPPSGNPYLDLYGHFELVDGVYHLIATDYEFDGGGITPLATTPASITITKVIHAVSGNPAGSIPHVYWSNTGTSGSWTEWTGGMLENNIDNSIYFLASFTTTDGSWYEAKITPGTQPSTISSFGGSGTHNMMTSEVPPSSSDYNVVFDMTSITITKSVSITNTNGATVSVDAKFSTDYDSTWTTISGTSFKMSPSAHVRYRGVFADPGNKMANYHISLASGELREQIDFQGYYTLDTPSPGVLSASNYTIYFMAIGGVAE